MQSAYIRLSIYKASFICWNLQIKLRIFWCIILFRTFNLKCNFLAFNSHFSLTLCSPCSITKEVYIVPFWRLWQKSFSICPGYKPCIYRIAVYISHFKNLKQGNKSSVPWKLPNLILNDLRSRCFYNRD